MAKSPRRATTATAGIEDMPALLGALGVRGRTLEVGPTPDASDTARIIGRDGRLVATVGESTLRKARRRGWIAATAEDAGLGLTPLGRDALRKARSRRVARRAAEAPETSPPEPASTKPDVNPGESPLTWLASRRDSAGRPMLSEAQVSAGERLRADLYYARLTPRVTMGWTGLPSASERGAAAAGLGSELADNVVAARTRATAALEAVGPELSDILIDVCGHLKGLGEIAEAEGWPRRAARLLLQRALTALARHYGLETRAPVEETIARRLRHWGALDYRPTLSRWSETKSSQED